MGDFGFNRPSNNNGENSGTGDGTNVDLSSYAKKNNPKFNGSVSMGRNADSNVGVNSTAMGDNVEASGADSHAEGDNTTASGHASHAEGYYTTANGEGSHAEGLYTTASNFYSHAEGYSTEASGYASHAEGNYTTASGDYSHAEGDSVIASAYSSHAEGYSTTANADYSHAEGESSIASGKSSHAEGRYTKASSKYQHVQGKYNIEDTTDTYAHIVGNGLSEDARSNAHTLDWDGNAWFAGNVTIGADNKELATKEYVDDAVAKIPNTPNTSNTSNILTTSSIVLANETIEFIGGNNHNYMSVIQEMPKENDKIIVTFDNVVYEYNATILEGYGIMIGNGNFYNSSLANNNEPICIVFVDYGGVYPEIFVDNAYSNGSYTIKIEKETMLIGEQYLPKLIGKKGSDTGEIFNNYKTNIATGSYSHAEGNRTEASNDSSHAEGEGTLASGIASHTEGQYTQATSAGCHAEGYNSIASSSYAHAEGYYTVASSLYAHAEGYYTKANGSCQHVQGKYNIEDTANKYAHIVGNGKNNTNRSNAHTLDWDGNAWYAGQVQGTNLPWSTLEVGELIIEQTVLFEAQSDGTGIGYTNDIPLTFAEGEKICFTFDDEQYICETRRIDEYDIYIGNGTLSGYDEIHNNEPFGIDFNRYGDIYIVRIYTIEKYAGLEVPVKIEKATGELHKLDEKFLPDTVATKEYVDGVMASASVNAVNAVSMDYVEGLLARIEALEKTIADLTNNNE